MQSFSDEADTVAKENSPTSQRILEEVATLEPFPSSNPYLTSRHIARRSCRPLGHVVTAQGVFAKRQRYFYSKHNVLPEITEQEYVNLRSALRDRQTVYLAPQVLEQEEEIYSRSSFFEWGAVCKKGCNH